MPIDAKLCTKCGEEKGIACFRKDAQKKDGLRSHCKACQNEAARLYQANNRDKCLQHTKAWREKNRDNYLEKRRNWAKSESGRAARQAWVEENRQKVYVYNRSRKAMRRGMRSHVSAKWFEELMALQKGKCAACRISLADGYHVDHIVPLARGGGNEKGNFQLLCPACNCSKGASHPVDFMQRLGLLL